MICFHIDHEQANRFQYAVNVVMRHEGGYANNKNDPGGVTNFGISLRYLIDIENDINGDGSVDAKDIKDMTAEEAKLLYKKYWWDKYGYNSIKDLSLATKIFDLSVNTGPSRAHKILQKSINTLQKESLSVDGDFGMYTLQATNKLPPDKLLTAIREQAKLFYTNLVAKKPRLVVFIKGWLARAES